MANYNSFKAKIQRNERGYQNLKTDFGNQNSLGEFVGTNYGVSAIVYEAVIGRPPSVADMKAITQEKAHKIFKNIFWDKIKADEINSQKLADLIADHAINNRPKGATKILQRTLNTYFGYELSIDGILGKKTLNAVNSVNEIDLFVAFAQARIEAYKTYRTCNHFCPIWFKRVTDLAKYYNIDINRKITPFKKNILTKINDFSIKKKIVIVGGASLLLLTGYILYSKIKNENSKKIQQST